MFANLLTLIIVIVAAYFYFKRKNKEKQATQPTHFGLLNSNGSPIQTRQARPIVQRLNYFCFRDKGYHISVWPKDQGIGNYVEFPIAGITHGEHVHEHLGELVTSLKPEPTNPYDSNAIAIITPEGHRIGYVPRDTTAEIRNFTTLPCACYCYIGIHNGTYFTDCYITRKIKKMFYPLYLHPPEIPHNHS